MSDRATLYQRGRVERCQCGLIQCACDEAEKHEDGCRYRRAILAPIAFACDPHGKDVCVDCDPCNCSSLP